MGVWSRVAQCLNPHPLPSPYQGDLFFKPVSYLEQTFLGYHPIAAGFLKSVKA
jgi:hypothetical protein